MNLYANHGQTFVPFRLRRDATPPIRCWLGGEPPAEVRPSRMEKATRHLATLGLEAELDVTLFSTFDYVSLQSPFSFFGGAYKLYKASNPMVEFVVHKQTNASEVASALTNSIPRLGFVFGAKGQDPACPMIEALGDPAIYADHKIGGQPFFSQLEGEVGSALSLLHHGHVHLLQITFPSSADTLINTNWPFGEYVFHVIAKKNGAGFEFHCIWG